MHSRLTRLSPLILVVAALGSGVLWASMPAEGPEGMLRIFSLLPLQLAALLWVLPRLRGTLPPARQRSDQGGA